MAKNYMLKNDMGKKRKNYSLVILSLIIISIMFIFVLFVFNYVKDNDLISKDHGEKIDIIEVSDGDEIETIDNIKYVNRTEQDIEKEIFDNELYSMDINTKYYLYEAENYCNLVIENNEITLAELKESDIDYDLMEKYQLTESQLLDEYSYYKDNVLRFSDIISSNMKDICPEVMDKYILE
ncbi:hypothetical protein C0585_07325 [Candidatus Woesearchaeota archaeon]|nr:MAG: hypothetical protein C0585_07325 [Candidatus Woesearchaeota archaeon]